MSNSEIIERMKSIAGMKEDQDLAKFFDIGKSTIANWRRGTAISLNNIMSFAQFYNVATDWLLFGKESSTLATDEKMALLAFNDLDDRQKMEAIAMMSNLKNGSTNALQSINGDGNTLAGRDVNIKNSD